MKIKNPFRTRYAVQSDNISAPWEETGYIERWCVVYRKWYQRRWRYAEMEYTGFGFDKMPVFYPTKAAAIASITSRTLLN